MGSEPAVSVIIPVHNGGAHLRECLDSVMAQSLQDLEVIVVDDASTDDTVDILCELVNSVPKPLRVITQPRNLGVSEARNAGLAAARGRYIAFVDADDTVRPRMYEHLLEVAEEAQLDMVSCGIQLFDAQGKVSQPISYPMSAGEVRGPEAVRSLLETGFTSKMLWAPVRSLYRRSLIEDSGIRFDARIRKGEDSLFNLEVLGRAQRSAAVVDAYYLYRKHAGSVTARPLPSESGNLEALGDSVTRFFRDHGFSAAATEDFHRYILASDIPTALVRLAGSQGSVAEIRRLRSSSYVRQALADLRRLASGVSPRVKLLLVLFKYAPARLVDMILAASRRIPAGRSQR